MANTHWTLKNRAPFEEVKAEIIKLAVEATDNTFYVRKDGSTIDVYAECEDPNNKSCWNHHLPMRMSGWRIIMYNCPPGYIGTFIKPKDKK